VSFNEPVDPYKRIVGWIITIVYLYGAYELTDWLDTFDLPTIAQVLSVLVVGLGGWVGLIMLAMHFDLMGDRKKPPKTK
jgi:flagellar motor component MotA